MAKSAPALAPYGSWKSPIGAATVAGASLGLEQISLDGCDVLWIEKRPEEGGRQVLVRLGRDGERRDVSPSPLSVRTRIHEYGGQCYTAAGGVIVFSNLADGRLYVQDGSEAPRAITPEGPFRYGDLSIAQDGSRVICVREEYGGAEEQKSGGAEGEPVDAVVSIELFGNVREGDRFAGGTPRRSVIRQPARNDRSAQAVRKTREDGPMVVRVLVRGDDFYGAPRLSSDGRQLAWLAWNHPNMPWDGSELWLGEMLADGSVGNRRLVAGGADESVFQPEWSPDGVLHFVSDRSGWWNLYRLRQDWVESLHPMEAEFGVPGWVLGLRTYDFAGPDRIVCAFCKSGSWRLAILNTESLAFEPIPLPFTHISAVRGEKLESGSWKLEANTREDGRGESAWFVASSPLEPAALVRLDLGTKAIEVVRRSSDTPADPRFLSTPQAIEFPTERGLTAHAFFYPPRNRESVGLPGEKPPLLVMCHGGPTDAASPSLSLGTQYWTSRGFAVVQVNYGGSTGYGRTYRERLNGQWGVVDVEDCTNAARALVAQGLVDGERMAIHGGSAGGFTALRALTLCDLFRAGAIYYGIGDLEMLAQDAPKFESRAHLRLVGPYPEGRDLYRERSPIHSAGRISAALIFFQGLDDTVVLPQQSEEMVRAVRARGLPVAYLTFEGEGHGFRRAETIRRALEAELFFYARVFGFELPEAIEPVPIENL
jgi:dipeptidyl aminopeptidase/acylaminoacyl peptidase